MIKHSDLPKEVQDAIKPYSRPDELPDDVREAIAPHTPEGLEMLDKISQALARKRDEAKTARTSSGIEHVWKACEEAYVGIDDANRGEFQSAKWSKPVSMSGPVETGRRTEAQNENMKSTAFVRLTARYVDAGASKLSEILLPIDDKSFSFSETPVPELIKALENKSPILHDGLGMAPLMRPATPDDLAGAAQPTPPTPAAPVSPVAPAGPGAVLPPAGAAATPAPPPQVPLTVADIAKEQIDLAKKKAKAAEQRIYDWMVECQFQAEMRKMIFDSARIGVGIHKGPVPKAFRNVAVLKGPDGPEVRVSQNIRPASTWVDPWNIFPDPACGENIHSGDYIFERDYLSEFQVRELKKLPGYIGTQIDKILAEGPQKAETDAPHREGQSKGRFEIWYFYGTLKAEEYDCVCAAAGMSDRSPPEKRLYHVIASMINATMIRAAINPLDSGSFPYDSHPWQRRSGHWAGIGVGEQVHMPQVMINAATRAMLDNAGISAGGQIVLDRSAIIPADGNWVITPNKIWYKNQDTPGQDVRQNFMIVEIPNQTDHMRKIIDYALQLAEESTSIPLISQGQSGATTPDTFGAAQLQNNNANQLLRSVGYSYDDHITEPAVRRYYEWLLLDPDVPDDEKGDFTIHAHGSVALVERAIQDQTIAQMAPVVANPIYGGDPKKWFKMYLKSKRIDPEDVQYTAEEQKRIDAQPPPKAPAIAAAEIRAQVAREGLVVEQQVHGLSLKNEKEIAAAAAELDSDTVKTDATVRLHELQLKREMAMLEYANQHRMTIENVRGELAKSAMQLSAQQEMHAADIAVDMHKHHTPGADAAVSLHKHNTPGAPKPPVQTPGKAGNGRAFEQGPTK